MSIAILSLLIVALFLDGWALSIGSYSKDWEKSEGIMRLAIAVECVALVLAIVHQHIRV